MLMNLGVGDNGVRILQEETVRNLLATSTRPENLGHYSLGLTVDPRNGLFGHGGAWGTSCLVNPDKKQLTLWVVQLVGNLRELNAARHAAAARFFAVDFDTAAIDAYTGRTE
jgi:CubicO group peptidase (beta-lactamase class C family)